MSLLTTLRQRRVRGASSSLGAFVLVWLSMVLQPCAMALGSDTDYDCPHCPPQQNEQPCELGEPDCNHVHKYNVDGRTAQAKVKDAPQDSPMIVGELFAFIPSVHTARVDDVSRQAIPPPYGPSLNILYCVYLK